MKFPVYNLSPGSACCEYVSQQGTYRLCEGKTSPGKVSGIVCVTESVSDLWCNVLGENINIMWKKTEALLDTSKEVGIEVKAEDTEMCVSVSSPDCMQDSIIT
jgi:hypothetical protein